MSTVLEQGVPVLQPTGINGFFRELVSDRLFVGVEPAPLHNLLFTPVKKDGASFCEQLI
jgi:hypothetical protein